MRTPVELKELSDKAVEAWNERRFDDYYGLYHEDVVYHGADGQDRRGVMELRAFYDSVLSLCPDLTITSLLVVADPASGLLASIQQERGSTAGGDPFEFEGMLFLRLGDDSLVHEAWEQIRPLSSTR